MVGMKAIKNFFVSNFLFIFFFVWFKENGRFTFPMEIDMSPFSEKVIMALINILVCFFSSVVAIKLCNSFSLYFSLLY